MDRKKSASAADGAIIALVVIAAALSFSACGTRAVAEAAAGAKAAAGAEVADSTQAAPAQQSSPVAAKAPASASLQATESPSPTGTKVTFIELGSVNCIPCKAMQPIMDEIRKRYSGQVEVVFHDVWTAEGRPYGAQFGIRVIPTQVFLDADGKEFFRHEGFFPMDQLKQVLARGGVEP